MGLSIARRLGAGRRLCIADFSNEVLSAAQETLTDDGYMVETFQVDVSYPHSRLVTIRRQCAKIP